MTTVVRNASLVVIPILAAAVLVSSRAYAQHEGHQTPAPKPADAAVSSELVNACVASQRRGATLADRAHARLEAARQTNDAAGMRAAVDELQSVLAQIKTELQSCDTLAAAVARAQADPHAAHQMEAAPPTPRATPAPSTPPARETASPATGTRRPKAPPARDEAARPAREAPAKTSPSLPVMEPERVPDPACPHAIHQKDAPTATYQRKVYYRERRPAHGYAGLGDRQPGDRGRHVASRAFHPEASGADLRRDPADGVDEPPERRGPPTQRTESAAADPNPSGRTRTLIDVRSHRPPIAAGWSYDFTYFAGF